MSNPAVKYLKKELRTLGKVQKMDEDLAKFGRKIDSKFAPGMVWTVGDLERYFRSKKVKFNMR